MFTIKISLKASLLFQACRGCLMFHFVNFHSLFILKRKNRFEIFIAASFSSIFQQSSSAGEQKFSVQLRVQFSSKFVGIESQSSTHGSFKFCRFLENTFNVNLSADLKTCFENCSRRARDENLMISCKTVDEILVKQKKVLRKICYTKKVCLVLVNVVDQKIKSTRKSIRFDKIES